MAERPRVLYLGLPLGALLLLRDGHDVQVACISRLQAPGMRRLRREMAARRKLVLGKPDLEHAGVQELLASVKPDLIVSWFWTRRIPGPVLAMAKRAFGVHPSLLPRHRGPDPYFWTLARRDTETGVTAHALTTEYDDGAVLSQEFMNVPDGCNSWQLAKALDRPSLSLMRELVDAYGRGEFPEGVSQDEALATNAPAPTDDDCELRWEQSIDDVLARIRAAAPEPGAFTGYGDDTIVITRARRAEVAPDVLEPGDVAATGEGVIVKVSDGAIVLIEARREGDEHPVRGKAIVDLFPGIIEL